MIAGFRGSTVRRRADPALPVTNGPFAVQASTPAATGLVPRLAKQAMASPARSHLRTTCLKGVADMAGEISDLPRFRTVAAMSLDAGGCSTKGPSQRRRSSHIQDAVLRPPISTFIDIDSCIDHCQYRTDAKRPAADLRLQRGPDAFRADFGFHPPHHVTGNL